MEIRPRIAATTVVSAVSALVTTAVIGAGMAGATEATIGWFPNKQACLDKGNEMFGPPHGQWWCTTDIPGNFDPNRPWRLFRGQAQP